MMRRLRKSFLRLRWQLTLRYMLVTVAAFVMVLVVAAVGVWFVLTNSNLVNILLISMAKSFIAPSVVSYLDDPQPNIQGLGGWLQAATTSEGLSFQSPVYTNVRVIIGGSGLETILLVLDGDLEFIAGVPELSEEHFKRVFDESEEVLAAALAGEEKPERISYVSHDQSLTLAVPVTGEKGDHLGVVMLRMANPLMGLFRQMLSIFGTSILFFIIAFGVIGAGFGFFTARGMTRRLDLIAQTTDAWSQGDFSAFIHDRSEDELGVMARRLDRMAEQLQNLLQTRQELASIKERNRLARDLHDSVKQQIFATTMRVGTARALLDQDVNAVREQLIQAEQLSRQAQTELADIIRELHPPDIQTLSLAQTLKAYVADWSRREKIAVEVIVQGERSLPLEVEQTLFRVAQEALTNVIRHSEATHVNVKLASVDQKVVLDISDNGVGFDIDAAAGKGFGLRSMCERMEAVGGSLILESLPGQGTRLIAQCQVTNREP